MTDQEIIQEFRERVTYTVENLFNEQKEVRQVLFGVRREGDNVAMIVFDGLSALFSNPLTKRIARVAIAEFITKVNPLAIAFVSEGWSVEAQSEKLDVPPSEHPDKKEILYINFETQNDEAYYVWKIIRDSENNPTLEEMIKDSWRRKSFKVQGNFTHLMGEPEPTEEEKIAMNLLKEEVER